MNNPTIPTKTDYKTPSPQARKWKKGIRYTITYVLLIALALFMTGPFLWLLSVSLMPGRNVFSNPPAVFPTFINFGNYAQVWNFMNFPKYIMNTVIITVMGVVFNIILSCMTAYPLAVFRFKGRDMVFTLLIATMIIPSSTAMIVHYLTIQWLNLGNTYLGVVLPAAVSVFNIFLMRQTFLTIPTEIRDSGKMDGASELRIWWQLVLPLVKPGIAVIMLLEVMAFWNNFLWPIVVLDDPEKYPLASALTYLNGQFSYNFGWIAAGTIISVIPIIVVFLFTQRYYMEGLAGAVKG
ncbi:sugar ABC transporter permease [Paenibacillus sp. CFBP13512]|uniref:carbohydrate ABC transporter permease n=1 Tax=Paenibacillus TaxID=44249 RepID=UPI0010C0B689|nr:MULTISPECIES: carbohydrate ABC transporter permease [Paenibacillus]TKJ91176.1 sugar ABC transporter permease [Paenibacillus sp. CFBP13512]CAJ1317583.1 Putative ABC transporter permease protein YurM [Paenibacillus nuruki]